MRRTRVMLILLIIGIGSVSTSAADGYSELVESFRIYTNNVVINAVESRSLLMETSFDEYKVKIVPTREGLVSFTLSDIRYRTTLQVPDLIFRVQAIGYINGEEVLPNFNTDKVNQNTIIDSTKLYFQDVYGGIPVWFNEVVDSVKLIYSNSHGLDLPQYLLLADIQLLPQLEPIPNPVLKDNQGGHDIMIAMDVSSSVSKREKKKMYSYFKSFTGKLKFAEADSALAYINFGSEAYDHYDIQSRREFRHTFKREASRIDKEEIHYTNWAAPLKIALEEKPKTLIMVTDGWSNYHVDEESIFTSHLSELVQLSNSVKKNGTRIIFITIGFNVEKAEESLLSYLLDGPETKVAGGETLALLSPETSLVAINDYTALKLINLKKLFP